jgi:excisionase family DNA binding protein
MSSCPVLVERSAAKAAAPAYLTPNQVGAMLQVSDKSVYRWLKDDPTMPALKIGGTVRFPRERLERWLRDREQGRPRLRSAP